MTNPAANRKPLGVKSAWFEVHEMTTIKDMVKDNKKVRFAFYRDHQLFYQTECGFEFPVPIDDIGNATFLAEDKAILFMR